MNKFHEIFTDTLVSNGWSNNNGTFYTVIATEPYQSNNGISSSIKLWAREEDSFILEFNSGYPELISSKGEKVWSDNTQSYREYWQAAKIIGSHPFHDLQCDSYQVQKAIRFLYDFMDIYNLVMCCPCRQGFLLVGKHK